MFGAPSSGLTAETSPFTTSVLLKRNLASPHELDNIQKDVEREVDEAVEFADKSPEPALDTLYRDIYSQPVSNMQVGGTLTHPAEIAHKVVSNGKH